MTWAPPLFPSFVNTCLPITFIAFITIFRLVTTVVSTIKSIASAGNGKKTEIKNEQSQHHVAGGIPVFFCRVST
jgi:hypothetical protein